MAPSELLAVTAGFLLYARGSYHGQKVPNLLYLSLIPCRRLYSGGSRTPTDESARLAWPSPILSGLGNHGLHTTGSRVAC